MKESITNFNMKVRCISIRESVPEQIEVEKEYYIESIWDDRQDWYAEVYKDRELKHKVGSLKLSHFTMTE